MPTSLQTTLFSMQDAAYRDFQSKLIPTVNKDTVIGVRTPQLRALAKELAKSDDCAAFLSSLPHTYFEENQLHAFVISLMRDMDECLAAVEQFLPLVDNWATCDQMNPKVFKKHRKRLLPYIERWLLSEKTYTVRFAIKCLMDHFLEDAFDPAYLQMVAAVQSEEYYVGMMQAWYVATALAKQYDSTVPLLETQVMEKWTHNKAIQKATESFRITPEQKQYLKTLKIR